jgi:YVTN family beta-propeller protein
MLRIPTGKTPKVLAVSQDGRWIAITNWHSDSVTVIDTHRFKPVATLPVPSIPRGIVFSRDGRRLYVAIMGGTEIDVFNTRTWKKSSVISSVGVAPREIILDHAGKTLYCSCNSSCIITKIDATRGKVVGSIAVGSEPRTIAFSPDEKRIYACCYGSSRLYVIDTARFKVVDTLVTGENPVGIAVTPSGDIWVTNQSGDSVTLFPARHKTVSRR